MLNESEIKRKCDQLTRQVDELQDQLQSTQRKQEQTSSELEKARSAAENLKMRQQEEREREQVVRNLAAAMARRLLQYARRRRNIQRGGSPSKVILFNSLCGLQTLNEAALLLFYCLIDIAIVSYLARDRTSWYECPISLPPNCNCFV